MNKRALVLVLLLGLAAGLSSGSAWAEPIPHGTDRAYSGYIETGHKFGVSIGDTAENARAVLIDRGMAYAGPSHCEYYPKRLLDCREEETWDAFRSKRVLKDGMIYIKYEDNLVVAIAWSFTLFPPMEF